MTQRRYDWHGRLQSTELGQDSFYFLLDIAFVVVVVIVVVVVVVAVVVIVAVIVVVLVVVVRIWKKKIPKLVNGPGFFQ